MVENKTGIQPQVREELERIEKKTVPSISSIVLMKDAAGIVTGGTLTLSDDSTIPITVETST